MSRTRLALFAARAILASALSAPLRNGEHRLASGRSGSKRSGSEEAGRFVAQGSQPNGRPGRLARIG